MNEGINEYTKRKTIQTVIVILSHKKINSNCCDCSAFDIHASFQQCQPFDCMLIRERTNLQTRLLFERKLSDEIIVGLCRPNIAHEPPITTRIGSL